MVGDEVEFFFEVGGEVVFDIVLEEGFEEGCDEMVFVFRNEVFFVDVYIVVIFEYGEC